MPCGGILLERNTFVYNSAPFRQAKTDAVLALQKPDNKPGSDGAWFVHWWDVRHPVWESTELEASSGLNILKAHITGKEHIQ